MGLISDGTVNWQFFSKAQPLYTGDVPSLSMTTVDPALGKSVLASSSNVGAMRSGKIFNCPSATYVDGFGNGLNGVINAAQTNTPQDNYTIEFMTDAPKFAIRTAFNTSIRIVVDGVSLTVGDFPITNGNPTWVIVDYSTSGRKMRKVTLIAPYNFKGVDVDTSSKVVPAPAPTLTGFWIGDSQANGGQVSRTGENWLSLTAKYLGGMETMSGLGVAGSGFSITFGWEMG
jgi:hypothetical protein